MTELQGQEDVPLQEKGSQDPQPTQPMTLKNHRRHTDQIPVGSRNPCCCKIETGVNCIAIFGIVTSVFCVGYAFIAREQVHSKDKVLVLCMYVVTGIIGLAFAIVLGVGVKKKSGIIVKIAFGGYIFMYVFHILCRVFEYGLQRHSLGMWPTLGGILFIFIITVLYGYMTYVIYAYVKQLGWLEREQGQGQGQGQGIPVLNEEAEGQSQGSSNSGSKQPSNVGNPQQVRQGQGPPQPVGQ